MLYGTSAGHHHYFYVLILFCTQVQIYVSSMVVRILVTIYYFNMHAQSIRCVVVVSHHTAATTAALLAATACFNYNGHTFISKPSIVPTIIYDCNFYVGEVRNNLYIPCDAHKVMSDCMNISILHILVHFLCENFYKTQHSLN